MKGTHFILRSLVADGVTHLFMVPGGLIDPFLPALQDISEITPIVASMEGGAAFMADGYARASGHFGACLCIGGPGLTNTVTPISAAYTDESPVLILSGEVATFMEGIGEFQDASAGTFNDTDIVRTITSESYSVPNVKLLHHAYQRAVRTMLDFRPGPVHLSLPCDVQNGEVHVEVSPIAHDLLRAQPFDVETAEKNFREVGNADLSKVAFLAGSGVTHDEGAKILLRVAERYKIPVATTQAAKGVFPEDHPLSLGVFGYAGTRWATEALLNSDIELLIVLGSGLKVRDSMHWSDKLNPKHSMIMVNISSAHPVYHHERVSYVKGHAGAFLRWIFYHVPAECVQWFENSSQTRTKWLADIKNRGPRHYNIETAKSDSIPIDPARMVATCREVMPKETIAVVDSGAHRAYATHFWESYGPRQYLTAANLGPMGWAIPAAIGAKFARPNLPVIVFTGDGCMQMHGLEIQTAARYKLPILFVVDNNQSLGNVWLRAHTLGPVPDELTRIVDHDWAGFARALGLQAETVKKPEELKPAIERALQSNAPYLLDVKCAREVKKPTEPYVTATHEWSFQE